MSDIIQLVSCKHLATKCGCCPAVGFPAYEPDKNGRIRTYEFAALLDWDSCIINESNFLENDSYTDVDGNSYRIDTRVDGHLVLQTILDTHQKPNTCTSWHAQVISANGNQEHLIGTLVNQGDAANVLGWGYQGAGVPITPVYLQSGGCEPGHIYVALSKEIKNMKQLRTGDAPS